MNAKHFPADWSDKERESVLELALRFAMACLGLLASVAAILLCVLAISHFVQDFRGIELLQSLPLLIVAGGFCILIPRHWREIEDSRNFWGHRIHDVSAGDEVSEADRD